MPTRFTEVNVQPGQFHLDLCQSFIMFTMPEDRTDDLKAELKEQADLIPEILKKKALGVNKYACPKNSNVSIFRRFTGMQKVAPTIALVSKLLEDEPSEKVVIFAVHKDTIETLKRELKPFGAVHIYGGTSDEKVNERVTRFNESKRTRVLISNIRFERKLELKTNKVLFVELDWVAQKNHKALKSCHSNATLEVCFVSLENSLDAEIVRILSSDLKKKKAPDLLECPR